MLVILWVGRDPSHVGARRVEADAKSILIFKDGLGLLRSAVVSSRRKISFLPFSSALFTLRPSIRLSPRIGFLVTRTPSGRWFSSRLHSDFNHQSSQVDTFLFPRTLQRCIDFIITTRIYLSLSGPGSSRYVIHPVCTTITCAASFFCPSYLCSFCCQERTYPPHTAIAVLFDNLDCLLQRVVSRRSPTFPPLDLPRLSIISLSLSVGLSSRFAVSFILLVRARFSFLFLLVICILVLLPFGFSSSPSFQLLSFLSAFVLRRMLVYRGTPTHLTRRSISSTRPTLSLACCTRARARSCLPLL